MELRTETEIAASADRVWSVLADFPSYGSWNPFIREVEGELREGARLRVLLGASGKRAMTFRPRLKVVEPQREIRWLGHLLVPGLFDGEHRFQIEELAPNRVRFVQSERFKGILLPLLRRALQRDTLRGFDEMNRALRSKAEGVA